MWGLSSTLFFAAACHKEPVTRGVPPVAPRVVSSIGTASPQAAPVASRGARTQGSASNEFIRVAVDVNHRSGVAPLAVFFDASGSEAAGSPRPFHELEYSWDFADRESGEFRPSGLSKNRAAGPLAGHVFERPGHYEVTLKIRDRDGHVAESPVAIDVLDPERIYAGQATVCFANQADFTGCPAGARRVVAHDLVALAAHVARGVRLLLRRGDTFTAHDPLQLNVRGPSQIGAFGSGSRPRILPRGVAFRLSDEQPNVADWTLMDLDIDGRKNERTRGVVIDGRAKNVLLLRLRATHVGEAFGAAPDLIDYYNEHGHPGHDAVDGFSIVDSEARELVGPGVLSYIGAHRLLMLGNDYYDSTSGEHVLRTPFIDRGVISSNAFGRAPTGRHVIKLHGRSFTHEGVFAGKFTERVILSDNRIESSGGHEWTVAIGPQNNVSDERIRDVIVERNRFFAVDGGAKVALALFAVDVSVRNNVFELGQGHQCLTIGRRGIEPPPRRITVSGNTCKGDGPNPPELVELDETVSEILIEQNELTPPRPSATR